MADQKVKDMTEEAAIADDDLFYLSTDEGGGSFLDRKVKKSAVQKGVQSGFHNESNGESSTTATDPQQKLRLTFTPPVVGDYEISFSALVTVSDTGVGVELQVQVDAATPKKLALMTSSLDYGDNGWFIYAGNFILAGLSAAEHTIDLDYSSEVSAKTAYIKEAVITARSI